MELFLCTDVRDNGGVDSYTEFYLIIFIFFGTTSNSYF